MHAVVAFALIAGGAWITLSALEFLLRCLEPREAEKTGEESKSRRISIP